MAIAAEWLEIAQWSQRRTYRKTTIAVSSLTLTTLFRQMGVANASHTRKLKKSAATWCGFKSKQEIF